MTVVEIQGGDWLLDGRPVHEGREWNGCPVSGLLLNSRMANGLFDDLNPVTRGLWAYPDTGVWDAERNTDELIAALPAYRASGLAAIGVNLQGAAPGGYYRWHDEAVKDLLARLGGGGTAPTAAEVWRGLESPRSQPWDSGAFASDGALRPAFAARAERLIGAADARGMAVCLGLFYFGQDERLRDEAAVRRAVDNACDWLLGLPHENVVVEVNNEADIPLYEHAVLTVDEVHALVAQVRGHRRGKRCLLAGTSVSGRRAPTAAIAEASDFLLLHGNGLDEPEMITARVAETRALAGYRGQPVVFNEDDHFDFGGRRSNFAAALAARAGWGYFDPGAGAGGRTAWGNYRDGYQNPPIDWSIGTPRKRAFFAMLEDVTGVKPRGR